MSKRTQSKNGGTGNCIDQQKAHAWCSDLGANVFWSSLGLAGVVLVMNG
jgi:hypothetical protein